MQSHYTPPRSLASQVLTDRVPYTGAISISPLGLICTISPHGVLLQDIHENKAPELIRHNFDPTLYRHCHMSVHDKHLVIVDKQDNYRNTVIIDLENRSVLSSVYAALLMITSIHEPCSPSTEVTQANGVDNYIAFHENQLAFNTNFGMVITRLNVIGLEAHKTWQLSLPAKGAQPGPFTWLPNNELIALSLTPGKLWLDHWVKANIGYKHLQSFSLPFTCQSIDARTRLKISAISEQQLLITYSFTHERALQTCFTVIDLNEKKAQVWMIPRYFQFAKHDSLSELIAYTHNAIFFIDLLNNRFFREVVPLQEGHIIHSVTWLPTTQELAIVTVNRNKPEKFVEKYPLCLLLPKLPDTIPQELAIIIADYAGLIDPTQRPHPNLKENTVYDLSPLPLRREYYSLGFIFEAREILSAFRDKYPAHFQWPNHPQQRKVCRLERLIQNAYMGNFEALYTEIQSHWLRFINDYHEGKEEKMEETAAVTRNCLGLSKYCVIS